SAEPYLNVIDLTEDDLFLILACDGLWDRMTYQQAVEFVEGLRREGKSPEEVAKCLTKEALDRNSLDNVSVIVVFFRWQDSIEDATQQIEMENEGRNVV